MQISTISQPSLNFTDRDAQSRTLSTRTAAVNGSVPQILCVDDDPEISRGIEMRLRNYLVDVSLAYFGMQGFWEAITEHPDLIIMDVAMPNGDGKFVLESLRSNSSTDAIPVIVLTGMRDAKIRNELLALGADQFLTKPIAFDDLLHEISRFIDLQERSEP